MAISELKIKHIIFCEDDDDDRLLFKEVLKNFDTTIKVEYVSNGTRLIEHLKDFVPDMLFLDLEMPIKNGLECLVEIRSIPVLKNLPIIVFSSTQRPANIQTAYDMGASLFLIKSDSYNEYAASLEAVLSLNWIDHMVIRNQYCVNGRYAAFS